MKWCVVIPAYGEATRIGEVVRAALLHQPLVIVVDDGSPDQTAAVAAEAGAVVLRHPKNRGKGAALATGFREAMARACEVVVTLDGDGQHDPAELPKFLEAYQRTGIPVLIGSRMAAHQAMPPLRYLTNRAMSGLLSRLMGHYLPDTQCGYRLYHRDVLPMVITEAPGYAAESEALLRLATRGVRMDTVPIRTLYGREKSKIRPWQDAWRFGHMLLRHRRTLRAWRKHRD